MRPRIGVTGNREDNGSGKTGLYIGEGYTDGVYEAGGLPFALPFTDCEEVIDAIAKELDGLLLSGGGDLAPHYFGEEPHLGLGEISPQRDTMETMLFARMLELQKPVLGICRGVQVMNAVLGGTLYQDLPREWKGNLQHAQKAPRGHMAHAVDIQPGTLLHAIYGQSVVQVNTFHHQAVRQLAPGCVASAHSRDGLIEAIERLGAAFVLGVQWHPENLWRNSEAHRRLFTAFVQAAALGKQAAHEL